LSFAREWVEERTDGHHHRRTGNRLTGTNGRPGVDMRDGVVTVATRTVADRREWDMVGSFRVVPGW